MFTLVADVCPALAVEIVLASFDLDEDVMVGLGLEGGIATDDDEEYHSKTPDVTAVVLLAWEHLGRNLVGSAGLGGEHVSQQLVVLGQPEVDQFDVPGGFVDGHEVFGLEVPVHNVDFVAVVHAFHNLGEHWTRQFLVQLAMLHNPVEQFSTSEQLHYQLKEFFVFLPFIQSYNIGVVQFLQDFQLSLEPIQVLYAALGDYFTSTFFVLVRL